MNLKPGVAIKEVDTSYTINPDEYGKQILLRKLKPIKIKKIQGKRLNKKDKELLKDWKEKNFTKYHPTLYDRYMDIVTTNYIKKIKLTNV